EDLPETIRIKEAAPTCEVLLGSDQLAAIEVHVHLSPTGEAKARGAALALREVEYPVSEQTAGGVIAREKNAPPNPEDLCNELGEITAFLGQVASTLGGRARLERGESSRDEEHLSECSRQLELARVALRRFRQFLDPLKA